MEIVLVRHGETEWTRSGQHTGRTDIPLTEQGRRQARLLGRLLGDRDFALVMTSPLRRAADTCALAGYGDHARVCDDLREIDYGEYEGRTTRDIRNEVPGWTVWTHPLPAGETLEEVGRRADRVLALARQAGGDVALFGHGHMLRVLGARWCGLPAATARHLELEPAAVCVLGHERETPVLRRWNRECPTP
ncbi:hypothetical protein TH66_00955 [Carbonactinospora thermoautotrophica]|uniref:Phosphoglycerate mutase n=1 Tax=Carbonactinospora thermoautotrophica TaxID=1469144 RepID=A0A132N6D3_9ACTN|nr:histidine phosphatase family protein [Carbonactinospora thermoautotrophica]KWX01407.1 hypothetical protein LI90_2435 [Carbonactinospora thermoautotrophica]KWX05664.1 hypothetical protein TH66_00955 [Carbonactinospora thermoautotrophica]KWX09722.1 hypothetical protein TR74_07905 [Carbonactinospora thermoautotrophica]